MMHSLMLILVSLSVGGVFCYPPYIEQPVDNYPPALRPLLARTPFDQAEPTYGPWDELDEHENSDEGNGVEEDTESTEEEEETVKEYEPDDNDILCICYGESDHTDGSEFDESYEDDDFIVDYNDGSHYERYESSHFSEEELDPIDKDIVALTHETVLALLSQVQPVTVHDRKEAIEALKVVVVSAEHAIEDLLKVLVLIRKYHSTMIGQNDERVIS